MGCDQSRSGWVVAPSSPWKMCRPRPRHSEKHGGRALVTPKELRKMERIEPVDASRASFLSEKLNPLGIRACVPTPRPLAKCPTPLSYCPQSALSHCPCRPAPGLLRKVFASVAGFDLSLLPRLKNKFLGVLAAEGKGFARLLRIRTARRQLASVAGSSAACALSGSNPYIQIKRVRSLKGSNPF